IKTTGEVTVNNQLFRVENTFELLQPEGYIAIKVKITNISAASASNVRLWVGTRDDWVGSSDGPTKERGNLINQEFELLTDQAHQAKAIKISSGQEAILFFSNSDRAYSTINNCCSFSNATNQDPATNLITQTGDGSYALYVRFNDLAVNESDELIWYYGAGTLPEIDEIIERVANAAIGAFDNITYNSVDYAATTVTDGTGYWVLVPDGSTPPTEAQIEAGVDYNGVTISASGNSAMLANEEHIFNLTDLEASTTYNFYFVSKYFDGVQDTYTEVIDEVLNTLEAPPIVTDFSPKTAGFGETITVTGSNFNTTSNVEVGGLNAVYTVIDSNTLEVVVPNGATDFYITVTNESGSGTIESEVSGNTDTSCSTGWSGAWQTLVTQESGTLRTVMLKLENTNVSNSYDLYLELHGTDNDPLSAIPGVKFSSLIETSQTLTIAPNTTETEVTFTFDTNTSLQENTSYYIVLKESIANLPGTGEQGIDFSCDSETDGGAGNIFGTLYHSFTMSPILQISNSPTDITLSPSNIQENNTINEIVGTLAAIDADTGDSHTFSLVAGTGDTDNARFTISGSNLMANEIFDFETKSSYSIRVETTDADGNTYEGSLIITITDEVDEDYDSDGVKDSVDNCLSVSNADQLDTDNNGEGDVCDIDDDGDGTPDSEDDFPLDSNEDTDTDGDGIGDNADTDDDGDGTPDNEDDFPLDANEDTDTDGDGTGDNADTDDDGDGTPDNEDDFPLDSNEDTDTDGDGTGNNADTDDDGDGTPDNEDDFPLDENEDIDTDGDGTGDNADTDDDGDGTPDTQDDFPMDENEDTDTDGDGIGDNADTDDDGDGTPDTKDVFPKDANEDIDTDGDGIGDNADEDADNDGILNSDDAFPKDSYEQIDSDGDGIGDNADTDDDNDGIEDVDTDGDGTGDNVDNDDDNDGVLDTEDAFQTDSTEQLDTDGDGTGDNTDEDDDNDGYSDVVENEQGTDAKDPNSIPKDTDGDGIPDVMDNDDDNDGVVDAMDDFPLDDEPLLKPAEAFTPNGDGVNDHWIIPGIDNYPNAKVTVFNRWGHEVYTAINYRNDWKGNYSSNSDILPPGSYLYVIDLGNGNAPIQGWIFINY
ncbi:MAG: gliding motility-associated C-terminal domain-containing protein, partial [Flavobacteriaceae bacterium]